MGTIALAALAGVVSTLSPCVLPLVPIVLAAAASEHRLGPLALGAGLALSFTVVGLFVATIGFAIGLDAGLISSLGALLLVAIGAVLVVPRFQMRFALAAGPVGNWAERRILGFSSSGLSGQFGVGLLLGAVWSPCVGPTLGAASVLAARGEDLGAVALAMLAFGLGTALPLALLGSLSRQALMRWRDRMLAAGSGLKACMGIALIALGSLILSGLDKQVETKLVEASPAWLERFSFRLDHILRLGSSSGIRLG